MRLPLMVVLLAFVAGISAPTPALADPADDFVRRSMEPRNFRPENYHADYVATVTFEGETTVLDRAETIALNEAALHDITDFRVTTFRILKRREVEDTVFIEYTYGYQGMIGGTLWQGEGEAIAVLTRGGPAGFRWLRSIQRERSLGGA